MQTIFDVFEAILLQIWNAIVGTKNLILLLIDSGGALSQWYSFVPTWLLTYMTVGIALTAILVILNRANK